MQVKFWVVMPCSVVVWY